MAKYTIENSENYTSIATGPLTQVNVTSLTHHVTGTGYAKLHYPDKFDEVFGWELAQSRAIERLNRKIQRKLIKSLG